MVPGGSVARSRSTHLAVVMLFSMMVVVGTSVGTITASGAVTVPEPPTLLTAIPGNGQVQLTWSASTDGGAAIIEYKVYLGTHPGHPFTSVSVSSESYLQTGLENGLTYYYMVSAVNQVGEGVTSDIVAAIPASSTVLPSAPTNLSAKTTDSSIELTWSAPTDNGSSPITRYIVYRGPNSTGMEYLNIVTGTSYVDTELANGERAYYSVVAVNSRGMGGSSDTVNAAIDDSTDFPIEYLVAGIAIAVIAIGIIFLLRRPSKP